MAPGILRHHTLATMFMNERRCINTPIANIPPTFVVHVAALPLIDVSFETVHIMRNDFKLQTPGSE